MNNEQSTESESDHAVINAPSNIDFLSIAQGSICDSEEFDESQRGDNCLTDAVFNKDILNAYNQLPTHIRFKPDRFYKLFHRPNYSVLQHSTELNVDDLPSRNICFYSLCGNNNNNILIVCLI